ncbi:MAG TPA: hypothetical protein VIC55_07435 [Gemmatimonadaceae bacterium]|jgi:hypothetical protein
MMRHLNAVTAGRVLFGLLFLVMGLNGFLFFLPQPKVLPEGAVAFFLAMVKTGYLMPLLAGTQVVAGVLLLSNRLVPLALAIVAPVVLNIFLFHAFIDPARIGLAAVVLALELFLAWAYRDAYLPMLAIEFPVAAGRRKYHALHDHP